MKRREIVIGLSIAAASVLTIVQVLAGTHIAKLVGLNSASIIGSHYSQKDPTMTSNGVKEYWVKCGDGTKYYSTKSIPNYNSAEWEDKGTYSGSDAAEDDRNLGQLFETTGTSDGGFTATKSESTLTINGSASSGWYLTDDVFYDCSFTVTFSDNTTENPYFYYNLGNSLILGAKKHSGFISGIFIDCSSTFTAIYEIQPNGTYVGGKSTSGSAYVNSIKSFNVTASNGTVTITTNNGNKSYYSGYYMGGSIGFYNTSCLSQSVTITNFSGSNVEKSLLANGRYNSGNDWTASNDDASSFAVASDGYALSDISYTYFNVSLTMSNYASENLYNDHVAHNSFVFGGGINEKGFATGYVIEFQTSFILIAKLNGDSEQKTGGALGYIERNISDSTFDVTVSYTNGGQIGITYRSGSTYGYYNLTTSDYSGGFVGFMSTGVTNSVTATIIA